MVIGTAGNLSTRAGDDHVLVTAAGADLGALTDDDLVLVDLAGDVAGPRGRSRPTSELPLHLGVYRATAARAIAHAHAPASIAVGLVSAVLPPVHYYTVLLGGVVRVADYALYGSAELAEHVVAALDGRAAALLRNHGSVAIGDTIEQACERVELVEWLADVHARAAALGAAAGVAPRLLDDAELAAAAAELRRREG